MERIISFKLEKNTRSGDSCIYQNPVSLVVPWLYSFLSMRQDAACRIQIRRYDGFRHRIHCYISPGTLLALCFYKYLWDHLKAREQNINLCFVIAYIDDLKHDDNNPQGIMMTGKYDWDAYSEMAPTR